MKSRQFFITCFVILTCFNCCSTRPSNRAAGEFSRQAIDPFLPVSFTPLGINYFLKHVYNRPDYASEFLPNNFSHMMQFLQHGLDTQQGPSYAQSVFKLFGNKLKAAPYINAYVFADMLAPLQTILKDYFVGPKPRSINQLKTSVNDVLYSSFLSQFDFFKKDPKLFFNNLSNEILTSLNHELSGSKNEIIKEQLRQTVVRFFELCISKIVWSPEESTEIWNTIKITSEQLTSMMKDRIIEDVDHLDDLFWSITHRFCFFIDLVGADLPISFYQTVKQDLLAKKTLLSKIDEQESAITSKSDHLMQTILAGEAKARASQAGSVFYEG